MNIIDIIIKDLKIVLSDKKATLILIAMPLILIAILGNALSSSFIQEGNVKAIKVAVVKKYDIQEDLDRFSNFLKNNLMTGNMNENDTSAIIQGINEFDIDKIFTEDFLESEELKKVIEAEFLDEEAALLKLNNKEVSAVIILPENFIYDMSVNLFMPFRNEIDIQVLGHPDRYLSGQIVEGIMSGFSDRLSSIIIGKNVYLETSMEEGMGNKAFENMGNVINDIMKNIENLNVSINYTNIEGLKPISGMQYYSAAMAAMFVLFSAGKGGELLLYEKKHMTYQRMTIGGIASFKIIFGKYLTIFILALLQLAVLIVFTNFAYGVNWGNTVDVILIALCTAFSASGLGILIATITFRSGNYKVADAFQSVVVQVMAFLGGSYLPMGMFPESIQFLGNFSLNGIALKAYLNVMQGGSISQTYREIFGLLAIGIVLSALAIYVLMGAKEVQSNA